MKHLRKRNGESHKSCYLPTISALFVVPKFSFLQGREHDLCWGLLPCLRHDRQSSSFKPTRNPTLPTLFLCFSCFSDLSLLCTMATCKCSHSGNLIRVLKTKSIWKIRKLSAIQAWKKGLIWLFDWSLMVASTASNKQDSASWKQA